MTDFEVAGFAKIQGTQGAMTESLATSATTSLLNFAEFPSVKSIKALGLGAIASPDIAAVNLGANGDQTLRCFRH